MLATRTVSAQEGAFFLTGNNLLEACTSTKSSAGNFCAGYVAGVSDAVRWVAFDTNSAQSFCSGRGVNSTQVQDIVIKYLKEHPEVRQYSAPSMIYPALIAAFPCQK